MNLDLTRLPAEGGCSRFWAVQTPGDERCYFKSELRNAEIRIARKVASVNPRPARRARVTEPTGAASWHPASREGAHIHSVTTPGCAGHGPRCPVF